MFRTPKPLCRLLNFNNNLHLFVFNYGQIYRYIVESNPKNLQQTIENFDIKYDFVTAKSSYYDDFLF